MLCLAYFSSFKPSLACKFFDTMISPILTYNSEVWGSLSNQTSNIGTPIEKGHLQFCKHYFQVNNKDSNIACQAELGRYSLIFDINKRILNVNYSGLANELYSLNTSTLNINNNVCPAKLRVLN